jgi:hypothetical protein
MKRYLFPLTVVAALALAGPASAKEVAKVKVCGTSGCHETSDKHKIAGIGGGGTNAGPPTSRSSFYKVTLTIRAEKNYHDSFTISYLPSQQLMRNAGGPDGVPTWFTVDAKTAALYDSLASGLQAFPASRLPKISAPAARVDEIVTPPAPIPPVADTGGGFPWLVLILAGGGLLVVTTVVGGHRRIRARRASGSSPAPTPAS